METPLSLSTNAQRQLDACVHCGFCLPVCPTYKELGAEADSPRGRLWLLRAAVRGETDGAAADFGRHLDLCLDCRACESACPSGVAYGSVIESARAARFKSTPLWSLMMRWLWLRPAALNRLARLVGLAQRLGLPDGLRDLAGLPVGLVQLAEALPPLRRPDKRLADLPAATPLAAAAAAGRSAGKVAVLVGCVQEALFPGDNAAMGRVLASAGQTVEVPRGQVCCGALHHHAGDLQTARALARRNVAAFAGGEGAIVVNASGCGALMKRYHQLLPDDPSAAVFAARVRDFGELVDGLRLPQPRPLGPARVTYHDPCHLAHGQGVRRQPRDLLARLPGIELVELEEADSCCGSAGVYNLMQWEMATAVLDRKIRFVGATRADWVVTSNAGCALQLRLGARRAGLRVRVRSLSEVLAEAYAPQRQRAGEAPC